MLYILCFKFDNIYSSQILLKPRIYDIYILDDWKYVLSFSPS